MGSLQCCQITTDDSFKHYCKSYCSPHYSQYLQSLPQQPTNAYVDQGQLVVGDWGQSSLKTGKGIIYSPGYFYYEGDIVDAKANGKGKILLPNKIIYQGYTQSNTAKGQGQLFYQSQQTKLKGIWSNGLPIFNTKMQLSIKDSKSFITFLSQDRKEFQERQQNKYQVKIQFENGNHYKGQIHRHGDSYKISGNGKMIFGDGSYYDGQFLDGKMHGYGQYYWKNGHWYKGEYRYNLRQGSGKYNYNSRCKQGRWVGGIYQKQANQVNEANEQS